MTDIKVISFGFVNAFVINSSILVDTGTKGCSKRILSKLKEFNINPSDIKLIVLTHGHDDHIGSVSQVAAATGAKVLISKLEYEQVKHGLADEIKPQSALMKFFYALKKNKSVVNTNPNFEADIIIDETFDLKPYGAQGEIVLTPGHSKGSISVLLGECAIIGDNLMAFSSKPKRPFIAYDIALIKASLNDLIKRGAKKFYLSHGAVYDLDPIEEALLNL
ncbi:MAG: MBL fold metallo-hydrolase [Eubacteriales bacterium]